MDITGRSVLITGASGGIGLATARLLASRGAKVALASRNLVALERTAAELRSAGAEAVAIGCDVTRDADVAAAVRATCDAFGAIDVLVNNAGRSVRSPVALLDIAAWHPIVDLDLYGPVRMIQAVVPLMEAAGGGVIVNVSSNTVRNPMPGYAGYAGVKAALDYVTRTARLELEPRNIRVLLIWPSRTATAFADNSLRLAETDVVRAQRRPGAEPDTAEAVAERIVWQIETETPETSMTDPVPSA